MRSVALFSLEIAYGVPWSDAVTEHLIGFPGADVSLNDGYALLATSAQPVPDGVIPFAIVDERSVACAVERRDLALPAGCVVRWHLGDIPARHQGRLLDTSVMHYLDSLEAELGSRQAGLQLMTADIMPAYEKRFLSERSNEQEESGSETDEERRNRHRAQVVLDYERPRGNVLRPVRMACQNVVLGLAAMAYDPEIDGLAVAAWQTCEVPHVGTHEANRALLALTLCDAFATGGTMEVRFDRPRYRHPEGRIPASLARFARTMDIDVFDDGDEGGLSPDQARDLFLACTPMHGQLGPRVLQTVAFGLTSIERICFTILSQTLAPVAMDFLLATTDRIGSILRGGDAVLTSQALAAELTLLETAMLLGLLVARLESVDAAGASVRVIEAQRHPVEWRIDETTGAVAIRAPQSPPPTWLGADRWPASGEVVVHPRSRPAPNFDLPATTDGMPLFALVPGDEQPAASVLQAPIRLSELRSDARAVLATLRSARV